MVGLGTWLALIAPTLARKVLAALGFGFVTFVGLNAALDSLLGYAAGSLNNLGGEVAALVALAGLHTAFGILGGAMAARLALVQLKRLVPV